MSHPLFRFVSKLIPVIHYIDTSVLLSDGADEVFFCDFSAWGALVLCIFLHESRWK